MNNHHAIHFEQNILTIHLHVQPNAKKTEIIGFHGENIKIKLNAPPVDGQANQALIKYFAKLLDRPQKDVEILRGDLSRQKIIRIQNVSALPTELKLIDTQSKLL